MGVFSRVFGAGGHGSAMSIGVGVALAGGIGAIGVMVGPAIVFSVPADNSAAVHTQALTDDEAETADGLRRLIASAYALIDFRTGDHASHGRDARATAISHGRDARATIIAAHGRDARATLASGELRLWIEDTRDPGVVNEDELLILTHSALLNAVLALTVSPGKEARRGMRSIELFSDDLAGRWRARSDVNQAVTATDVTAMLIEPIGRNDDGVALRVRLTFARPGSDLDNGSRRDAEFVVRVREIKPEGAKGARE